MAVDAYMMFKDYKDKWLVSEAQTDFSGGKEVLAKEGIPDAVSAKGVFEIDSYSFGVHQSLNIGSQSSGAGAGKVSFGTFSISRKVDKSSPLFYQNCCAGTPFKQVILAMRKSSGTDASGQIFLRYDFKLCAVASMQWGGSGGDDTPAEQISFEYGGLIVQYSQQKPDGTMDAAIQGGWNRVKNISDVDTKTPIT